MRRHHIVGIPPSELGGIATLGQDPKGGNTGSGSGSPKEHPARHRGHGANLPLLVFTCWLPGCILIMNCETPSTPSPLAPPFSLNHDHAVVGSPAYDPKFPVHSLCLRRMFRLRVRISPLALRKSAVSKPSVNWS